MTTRVLIARGHSASPWDLSAWSHLPPEFDIGYLRTRSSDYDTSTVPFQRHDVVTMRDLIPAPAVVKTGVTAVIGDRHFRIDDALAETDIVHAAELSYWFTADLARRKARHRYKLVVTVWETIPFAASYRNASARRYRREVLANADIFVAATERARQALLLEGVDPGRVVQSFPGVDTERFESAPPHSVPERHLIVSPGRLVWEKGHQDAIRAIAALHRGAIPSLPSALPFELAIVGSGPERNRLAAHAEELGVGGLVNFRSFVPHDEMPAVYASASALVLGSLPMSGGSLGPLGIPRVFWEEQFGLVFAEAMASGLDIIAGASGAIPEVLAGQGTLVMPGDWMGIAKALADGPLQRPPAARVKYPPELVERYSSRAAGERLAAIYADLVDSTRSSSSRA